jgi:hypothetical protein
MNLIQVMLAKGIEGGLPYFPSSASDQTSYCYVIKP